MRIKAKLNFNGTRLQDEMGLRSNGKVQKYIDQFVLYHCEPYVAGKHIHDAGVVSTRIGSGKVIWNSPDAEMLYDGKLMVDPVYLVGGFPVDVEGHIRFGLKDSEIDHWVSRRGIQKKLDPNGRNLTYHQGGKRGSKWFDRMIEAEMDDSVNGIENILNGGGG